MAVEEKELVQTLLRDRGKLIAYIWSMVRDVHTAEDIFQEVSLVAVAKRSEIDGPAVLLPWLRSVSRHKSLKSLASTSKRPVFLDDQLLEELESVWARQDRVPRSETGEALGGCVQKLSEKAKRIIGLRYGSGLSGQDIAQAMGVRVASIYQALSRIHIALKDCVRRRLGLETASEGTRE